MTSILEPNQTPTVVSESTLNLPSSSCIRVQLLPTPSSNKQVLASPIMMNLKRYEQLLIIFDYNSLLQLFKHSLRPTINTASQIAYFQQHITLTSSPYAYALFHCSIPSIRVASELPDVYGIVVLDRLLLLAVQGINDCPFPWHLPFAQGLVLQSLTALSLLFSLPVALILINVLPIADESLVVPPQQVADHKLQGVLVGLVVPDPVRDLQTQTVCHVPQVLLLQILHLFQQVVLLPGRPQVQAKGVAQQVVAQGAADLVGLRLVVSLLVMLQDLADLEGRRQVFRTEYFKGGAESMPVAHVYLHHVHHHVLVLYHRQRVVEVVVLQPFACQGVHSDRIYYDHLFILLIKACRMCGYPELRFYILVGDCQTPLVFTGLELVDTVKSEVVVSAELKQLFEGVFPVADPHDVGVGLQDPPAPNDFLVDLLLRPEVHLVQDEVHRQHHHSLLHFLARPYVLQLQQALQPPMLVLLRKTGHCLSLLQALVFIKLFFRRLPVNHLESSLT